jgi:signal transduction histidine kinase
MFSTATIFKKNLRIKGLNQDINNLLVYKENVEVLTNMTQDYKTLLISTYCPRIYLSVNPDYSLDIEFYSIGWSNLFSKDVDVNDNYFDEVNTAIVNEWKTNILEVYRTGIPMGPVNDLLLLCMPSSKVKEFNLKYYLSKDRLGDKSLIKIDIIDETEIVTSIRLSKEKEELARVLLQMTTHQIKNKARTLSLVLEELEVKEEKIKDIEKLLEHRKCTQDDELINNYNSLVQSILNDNITTNLKQKTKEILSLTEYIAKLCHQNIVAIEDTVVNLNVLVARACLEISFPVEQIKYNLRYCVKGDKHLLTEVFIEILSNSRKYSHPDRELFVEITANEIVICGEKALLVTITDNGIGVPTNKLISVIEPYIRLNKQIDGTGLGLTFVKQILRRHNAELSLLPGVNGGLSVQLLFKGGYMKKNVNCHE